MPPRTSEPGLRPTEPLRTTEPPRPPILPLRPSTPNAAAPATTSTPHAAPPPLPMATTSPAPVVADRASEAPPTSSITAAMLIPRPSQPPAAGRVSDPGGDPLRERLAQVEVQSAATRSIASRVESETARAHGRLDALDPRLGTIESALRERAKDLEAALESVRRELAARLDQVAAAPRATPTEDPTDVGALKTALATLRQNVAEHDRQFEARRARVESVETRVAALETDPRMVELRRATEGFDLRIVAIERAQEALRSDVDARLHAIEARLSELAAAPTTGTTKKLAAAEPELRRIKGVGPKYEKALREAGITTIAQVAAMSDDDLARVAERLSVPVERVRKLGWPDLARALLAAE